MKKMVMFFMVVTLLALPSAVMAEPVPDTGQSKFYDNEGVELKSATLPTKCDDPNGCIRTLAYESGTAKDYYYKDGDTCTKIGYYGFKRFFNSDGTEDNTASYPKIECRDASTTLPSFPTQCYTSNTNCKNDVAIDCPITSTTVTVDDMGFGAGDFYGQDAHYDINEQGYTTPFDGGDFSVKDERTGLIWLMKEDLDPGHTDSKTKTNNKNNKYAQTNGEFVENLNLLEYEDNQGWRFPTVKELALIVNCGVYDPAIHGDFDHVQSGQYWTSTSGLGGNSSQAYCVNFDDGTVSLEDQAGEKYVIAVRQESEESAKTGEFVDNGDETITDTNTGLMWRKASHTQNDWEGAMLSCEALDFEGYSDWRLPSRTELLSIVDYTKNPDESALIDSKFTVDDQKSYWTSTSYLKPDDPPADPPVGKAWAIDFNDGTLAGVAKKTGDLYVLAVRGGQNKESVSAPLSMPPQAATYKTGRVLPIICSSNKIAADAIMELSRDGGKDGTFAVIDGIRPEGNTSLIWTVEGPTSDNCVLRLLDKNGVELGRQGLFSIEEDTGGDPKWDVNGNNDVDLADIICGLQMLTGGTCGGK